MKAKTKAKCLKDPTSNYYNAVFLLLCVTKNLDGDFSGTKRATGDPAWLTRPECPKGAKDKVKRPEGPPTRS